MIKRVPSYLVIGALLLVMGAGNVLAVGKSGYTIHRDRTADQIVKFSIPMDQLTARVEMLDEEAAMGGSATAPVISLGAVSANSSMAKSGPGFALGGGLVTYEDWQYSAKDRKVDFSDVATNREVHFSMSQMGPTFDTDQYGYLRYKPTAPAGWPNGTAPCLLQNTGERGLWPNIAVSPEGNAVLYGSDNVSPLGANATENHAYYQEFSSCTWGTGTQIPPSKYRLSPSETTGSGNHPQVEIQVIGSDTITQVLIHRSVAITIGGGRTGFRLMHFRKGSPWGNSGGDTTLWVGPHIIDSSFYRGSMATSTVSNKVAVVYVHLTALALAPPNQLDQDIYYRESTDGGLTFNAIQNVTNYNRNVKSYAPWLETHCLYDTNDKLHILWNANPLPAHVYDSLDFFWGDFSASLFHWSNATGNISRVANADYGIAFNTQVCGHASGFNSLYIAFFNISECDGNLYTVWSQHHKVVDFSDPAGVGNDLTDCATSSPQGRPFQSNAELYLSVSSDLTGLLWDAPRNLSNTYTPDCDSATGGGTCFGETKSSMSRYGQSITGTWPAGSFVDPSGSYAGGFTLHLTYLEDLYPGQYVLASGANRNPATPNVIKWARLACVNPVTAAQIAASPLSIGYPEWRNPSDDDTVTVTVTNDGNAALNITTIGKVQTSGPAGWLQTSVASLSVPAGVSNTGTFNIIINAGGVVASGPVSLNGYVYMLSNAANNDSLVFAVDNYIIADTVVGVVWDTVNTANGNVQAATGRISLIVGSHGNWGRSGLGRVNLDYAAMGIAVECDTLQDVYMFAGGPLVERRINATTHKFSTSAFTADFADPVAFKPIDGGPSPSQLNNATFESFTTGIFVNEDSLVGLKQTVYAPKSGGDSADFVIVMTKFWARSGSVSNLLLGDLIDWDVPADVGATNKSGVVNGNTVYQRGTDTGALTACNKRTRFAANAFLGMYTRGQFNGNSCFNDAARYGQFAKPNDPYIFDAPNGVYHPETLWTLAGALSGAAAVTDSADLHTFTTYKYNYTLGNAATDTLTVYTALTTVRDGDTTALKTNIKSAQVWYNDHLRTGCSIYTASCCVGTTGNVDNAGVVDIGDLTFLIDHLFISFIALPCPAEGNVDGAGVVDIGDLTYLIDHLFISFIALPPCS